MDGEDTEIGEYVAPGDVGEVSVTLTTPDTDGTYTGYWILADSSGIAFGSTFYVQIVVSSGLPTSTPTPTPASTSSNSVRTITLPSNSVSVQIVPAQELPKTPPEVTGQFVERKDNTIVVASAPLETGGGGDDESFQETVGEGTLDDLNSDSMIRVWGRKSGDRIIAEVLLYSNPVNLQKP